MDLIITDTRLLQTFMIPAEFLLSSMYGITVKTDSDSIDFRLLQTNIRNNAGYNRHNEITTTAGMLTQP